jgi:hypothetical protein
MWLQSFVILPAIPRLQTMEDARKAPWQADAWSALGQPLPD